MLRRIAGKARNMTENALSILSVIFSVQLQQTEISERKLFIFHLGVSLWNDLASSVFDGVGLAGLRAGPMLLYWPKLLYHYYCLLLSFPLSSFCL